MDRLSKVAVGRWRVTLTDARTGHRTRGQNLSYRILLVGGVEDLTGNHVKLTVKPDMVMPC